MAPLKRNAHAVLALKLLSIHQGATGRLRMTTKVDHASLVGSLLVNECVQIL